VNIIYQALEQPVRYLARNSGEDDGYVVKRIEESKENDFGFNSLTG